MNKYYYYYYYYYYYHPTSRIKISRGGQISVKSIKLSRAKLKNSNDSHYMNLMKSSPYPIILTGRPCLSKFI